MLEKACQDATRAGDRLELEARGDNRAAPGRGLLEFHSPVHLHIGARQRPPDNLEQEQLEISFEARGQRDVCPSSTE